jgi:hypothetical protein
MIIRSDKLSLLPSLCYKAKRTVGFSPMAYNDKVFEKGICHPFQKSNNKLANYFLQKRCYKIGFGELKDKHEKENNEIK